MPLALAEYRALVAARDVFVMTSNVDDLFVRNGFDPARASTRRA